MTMSAMQAEVFEAFRSIDVPEDKAIKAATALTSALTKFATDATTSFNKRDADIDVTRTDVTTLKSDIDVIRKDVTTLKSDVDVIRKDVTTLKSDMAVMKWMMGTTLAMLVTILFRVFTH